jgi:hypothetical protein
MISHSQQYNDVSWPVRHFLPWLVKHDIKLKNFTMWTPTNFLALSLSLIKGCGVHCGWKRNVALGFHLAALKLRNAPNLWISGFRLPTTHPPKNLSGTP